MAERKCTHAHWRQRDMTQSTEADKSSSASPTRSPRSIASRMSASTLTTAVSTEWCSRYADWVRGNRLLDTSADDEQLATPLTWGWRLTDMIQSPCTQGMGYWMWRAGVIRTPSCPWVLFLLWLIFNGTYVVCRPIERRSVCFYLNKCKKT